MKTKTARGLMILIIILIFNGCSFAGTDKSNSESTDNSTGIVVLTPTYSPGESDPTSTATSALIVSPTPIITATPIITSASTVTPTPSNKPVPTTTPPTSKPNPINYQKSAEEILKTMTLEEKVGQMFFVRCRNDKAAADIKAYQLGGYILFAEDFKDKTKDEVVEAIQSYQVIAKIPMLIGVDEEGGSVNRISKFTEFRAVPFKSPQDLYKLGGYKLIISDTVEKSKLLKSLGINVNLAPVCDVSTNPKDFIFNRSFGKNAEDTSEYVKTVVSTMNSQGIGSSLKHFPGYGNNVDTHTGIAIDNRSYDSFLESDFLPFQAGIKTGAGSILVSHNIVKSMDENYPASLSSKIHKILREDLDFDGVIMTDDLSMDAIKQYTNDENSAVLAILAGNDLIVASNFDVQIPAVISAVKDNTISEERINESVMRILLWKLALGIVS